jgi:hypothetical protein
MAPFLLLLFAVCVGSIFLAIAYVRPLMVTHSDWYGLLLIPVPFIAFGLFYAWAWLARRMGIRCPFCGSSFVYLEVSPSNVNAETWRAMQRRCSHCQRVLIDFDR